MNVEGHNTDQLVETHPREGQPKTFNFEETLGLTDLLDHEVVNILIKFDRMVAAMRLPAEHKLQLWVRLAELHRHHIRGL